MRPLCCYVMRTRVTLLSALSLLLMLVPTLTSASMTQDHPVAHPSMILPEHSQDDEWTVYLPIVLASLPLIGTWEAVASLSGSGQVAQIDLSFGQFVPTGTDSFKASGSISWDAVGSLQDATPAKLPLMATMTHLGGGVYDLFILANVVTPGAIPVIKLTGTADLGASGLGDDTIEGKWYRQHQDGTLVEGDWSAIHLDKVAAPPEIRAEDPFYFRGDLKVHLFGTGGSTPIEARNPMYAFDLGSNILMDHVRVTFPDGTSVTLPPYTDVFSPGVDWQTEFRFVLNRSGLPEKGTSYLFEAMDVVGNPISGVSTTDLWVGVRPPDPPSNVNAQVVERGIRVRYDPVAPIKDSFEPQAGIGWYQIEVSAVDGGEMTYGAAGIDVPEHIIPKNRADFVQGKDWGLPLSEMEDGTYTLTVNVHSVAPEGSAGLGIEYSSRDPNQVITFVISGGLVIVP